MRILYHHRTRRTGVEGVHISGVINGLRKLGHEVTEVALIRDDQKPAEERDGDGGGLLKRVLFKAAKHLPNELFRLSEVLYNPIAFFKLSGALSKKKYDFIYERFAYFNFSGTMARRFFKIPLVLEVNIVADMQDVRKLELTGLAKFVEKRVILSADAVFVVSNYLKDRLVLMGVEPGRIHVQPNAFDIEEDSPVKPAALAEKLSGRVVVGFLGRLLPWYKLDRLMEAFAAVHRKRPETHLLFIGDGAERTGLEATAASLALTDHVTFCGEVSHGEALSHLNLVHIGVIPSTNMWGSPVKLLEYMGKGVPVVAPDIDVITSVMSDGMHGRTFRYDDFDAFEKVLGELAGDKEARENMGRNARKHVLENHTWAKVAENITSVAEGVLKGAESS